MNKLQIILPLTAILIVVVVGGIIHGCNQARNYVQLRSQEIGRELILETNSTHVVQLGPSLKSKLNEFLGAPSKIEAVSIGDEKAPIGDGRASSQLWLINERRERIVIRLRQDKNSDKFHILGYWTPSAGPDDPNHSIY